MKTTRFSAACLLCIMGSCVLLLGSPRPGSDVPLAFRGEVMDSVCAQSGSHDSVMRSKGITDSRNCVAECLKDGGRLVLRDAATGSVYGLDAAGSLFSQDRLLGFAGEKVKIVGSLDENAKRIWHIQSVEPL
jgi:hypothetical protein